MTSTLEKDLMAPCSSLKGRFAALPREIRDMVFAYIASIEQIQVAHDDNYCLHLRGRDESFAPCIEMLHEWAPRSHIAKAACEVLWSCGTFHHLWYFNSRPITHFITDPHATLTLKRREGDDYVKKSLGSPIDLRDCVQNIEFGIDHNRFNPVNPVNSSAIDTASLLKLKQGLSQLHRLPHLRQMNLTVWIVGECDAYSEPMAVVEAISDACKYLRGRIGAGLTVTLARAWLYDDQFIEQYDISWMWIKPSQSHRQRVRDGIATADEKLRVLIADGVDPALDHTLLEELRSAASFLPQLKKEVVDMDAWEPWTGVDEARWLRLKKWSTYSDDI